MLAAVTLSEELARVASLAGSFAARGETVGAVLATEATPGRRVYVCAFVDDGERRSWIALDREGRPIEQREPLRQAVSLAVLCEVAAETAGGGALDELRAELVALRLREHPPGIEKAEDAALALERAVGSPPRVASPDYLDAVGVATKRLERALGDGEGSPFAAALQDAAAAVEALTAEVEHNYKRPLT
jgi:hypothetical protein